MSYLFDQMKAVDGEAKTEDKVLLMGLQAAGKSAIKDVVFFGKNPDQVENYMATIHYERQYIDEEKNSLVIDSGGQESYWNEAVTHFRHLVFSNVKLLLWIIDVTRQELFEESERRFSFTIRQYKKENPDGMVVVLCHKVDLITPEDLVPLLEHIRKTFTDPKYPVRFEASSIFYYESLKELIFTLMKEANMNVDRFELITNLGEKVQQSEEFQSYVVDHQGDPRIKQLMDYLHPEMEITLPTFGKVSTQFDLSSYDIVEIVLIDKETMSPVTGTSSRKGVTTEMSMEYIIALQEFKEIIREKKLNVSSEAAIISSSNGRVHAMVFNMQSNFLLITSFVEISEQKTKQFYKLISEFAKSIDTIKSDVIEKIEEKAKTAQKITPEIKAPIETKPIIAPSIVKTAPTEIQPKITTSVPVMKKSPVIETKKLDQKVIVDEKLKAVKSLPKSRLIKPLPELEDEVIEPVKPPIIEEKISEEELEINQAITEEIEHPTQVEEQTSLETQSEEEISVENTPKIEDEQEKVIQVEEQPEIIEPEMDEIESIHEEEEKPSKKGKSRFVERLQEESKRYRIKQIAIEVAQGVSGSEDKLHLSEKDIEELARFLKERAIKTEDKE
ncbi:MAG: ADP-ribosylation factor-like protein [Candidatus Thorarchaeota archaeon]